MKLIFNFISVIAILFSALVIFVFSSSDDDVKEDIANETYEIVEDATDDYISDETIEEAVDTTSDLMDSTSEIIEESTKEISMDEIKNSIKKTKKDISKLGSNIYEFITNLN